MESYWEANSGFVMKILIVGAGLSGCSIARLLNDKGHKVLHINPTDDCDQVFNYLENLASIYLEIKDFSWF